MTKNRLGACRQNPFGACRQNLPALILIFGLLMAWQLGAMKVNAAYILPTPVQILRKLWELRVILFTVHLPATMTVTFVGQAADPDALNAGDDAAEAAFYPLDALPGPLCFDHARAVDHFRQYLTGRRPLLPCSEPLPYRIPS